jgi:hypothetical protein
MENAFLDFLFLAGLMALRDVASTLIILRPMIGFTATPHLAGG